MSKVIKEFRVATGSYTDKNGEEKKRYSTVGMMIETRNGVMAKLDFVPLVQGGWDGWMYVNDPRPKEGFKSSKDDDDIPWK